MIKNINKKLLKLSDIFSNRILKISINIVWIIYASFPIHDIIRRGNYIGALGFSIFGLMILNIGMKGIEKKKIYTRVLESGVHAVKVGLFFIFSAFFLVYYINRG